MDQEEQRPRHTVKSFGTGSKLSKFLTLGLAIALLGGVGTGYVLAQGGSKSSAGPSSLINLTETKPQTAAHDNTTFRDFAEGKVTAKAAPKGNEKYSEGTHLLIRENQQPVALTSSVVDLSEYENKNVKVFGETQKALKEGWLMDVGRVEVK